MVKCFFYTLWSGFQISTEIFTLRYAAQLLYDLMALVSLDQTCYKKFIEPDSAYIYLQVEDTMHWVSLVYGKC